LVAFFDALILSDRLPIIDYGITFEPPDPEIDAYELYQLCNQHSADPLLINVHVMAAASHEMRQAALAELRGHSSPIPADLATSVLQELSAFDYGWRPYLEDLEQDTADEAMLTLKRFMYGHLLFTAYAQMSGAAHLVQPKRSRLYLAMSLGASSAAYRAETALFDKLDAIFNQALDPPKELADLPPFLPYLLSKDPRNLTELLQTAIHLREEGEVRDYRALRTKILRDWRDKGRRFDDLVIEKELQKIKAAVRRKLQTGGDASVGATISVKFLPIPSVEVQSLPLQIAPLWGWILQQLPGRRYSKLLTRMMLASESYERIDRHLYTLWRQA
jgi:hypothetical protein